MSVALKTFLGGEYFDFFKGRVERSLGIEAFLDWFKSSDLPSDKKAWAYLNAVSDCQKGKEIFKTNH